MTTIHRRELDDALRALLEPDRFDDYAPNGLQVEGRDTIGRIVTGVSANQALIDEAVASGADAVLVHHGFFWKNEPRTLTGVRARRVGALLREGISLFAYHLPLDAHPAVGNNAGLLRALGVRSNGTFATGGSVDGHIGALPQAVTLEAFAATVEQACMQPPLVLGASDRPVKRVAVCTGGAAGYFEAAAAAGADVYITGEPSEQSQGLARELGIPFIAAGHHATERFGPLLLGGWLEKRFGVEVEFIDIANPV